MNPRSQRENVGRSSFASDSYLHAKAVWKGVRAHQRRQRIVDDGGPGSPFGTGRDPKVLGDVLFATATDMGWSADLDQARLFTDWDAFVGQTTAEHTTVLGLHKGVLQVQCDSTAWATELRRLRAEMLTRILKEYPDSGISELKFLAPGAPSWKHGPRSVRGRGPRDTYG